MGKRLRYYREHPLQALDGWRWRIWFNGHNRWLDLRGRLAGYCMADTWRWSETRQMWAYEPGYSHWRCVRRRGHPGKHRFINYVWDHLAEGGPAYDPAPPLDARLVDGARAPKWMKHHASMPRKRARYQAKVYEAKREQRRLGREITAAFERGINQGQAALRADKINRAFEGSRLAPKELREPGVPPGQDDGL